MHFSASTRERELDPNNEEPGVGAKRRRLDDVSLLSNGRVCAGASEKIPRTFAQSLSLIHI